MADGERVERGRARGAASAAAPSLDEASELDETEPQEGERTDPARAERGDERGVRAVRRAASSLIATCFSST